MAYCERGKHYHGAAIRRAEFRQDMCPDCYLEALRADPPSRLVVVPRSLRAKPADYIPRDPCRGNHYDGRGAARAFRRVG